MLPNSRRSHWFPGSLLLACLLLASIWGVPGCHQAAPPASNPAASTPASSSASRNLQLEADGSTSPPGTTTPPAGEAPPQPPAPPRQQPAAEEAKVGAAAEPLDPALAGDDEPAVAAADTPDATTDDDTLALAQAQAPGRKGKREDRTSGGRYKFRTNHDPNGTGKFYMGREIAHVMGFAGAPWLERPEREREEATSKMIEALALKPGMVVADIGAGSGVITLRMAEKVGADGKVIAVDVQQEMLDLLQNKDTLTQFEKVALLLGTEKSPRLDPESVDLAIMGDVYHELAYPYEMLLELSKGMKVGGRVVFVEFRLEDPEVPIKLVHKMSQAQVKREISPPELNLKYRRTIDTLPWQHVMVFEKVGPDGGFQTVPDTQPETTPLTKPEEALAKVRMPEGFQTTLFAAEPDVRQPIHLTTDERGRLWVAENYSYAESAVNFVTTQHDRIVILEDTDGDGKHDQRKVFFDEGRLLTSIELGYGGVFALCAPQLLWIPDLDQDDIPDGPPVVLLDGFDDGPVRHNIVNGLKWGPDGWLYGRHGILATSNVGVPGATESQRTRINCGVWRYHPIERRFEAVAHGTTNPWGHDWDEHGELFFINTVIGHLWHVIPGAHFRRMYGSDFDPHVYQLIEQTADHFHWDTREAWSDIRKGVTDTTSAAGGGHAHSGLMIYLGDNWPNQYRNGVFTVNLHGHRLNRDRLERDQAGYTARHEPDFVFFDDPWFRGIELIAGPDGGVVVADWSDIGECHENDGVHRGSGRLFKITHGTPDPARSQPNLGEKTSLELAELMLHSNEWHVRTATRLLRERVQRGDDAAALKPALDRLGDIYANHADVTRRLRALWALWNMQALDEAALRTGLADASENVQAWCVRLLVDRGAPSRETVAAFVELARTAPGGLPLLHLAGALQKLPLEQRGDLALALAKRGEFAGDRALPLLVWYGLEPAVLDQLQAQREPLFRETKLPHLRRFLARRLTEELERRPADVDALVGLLKVPTADSAAGLDDAARLEVLTGMAEGLRGWRKAPRPAQWDEIAPGLAQSENAQLAAVTRELSALFGDGRAADDLKAIVTNNSYDPLTRRQALRALAESQPEGLAGLCHSVLTDRAVDIEAIRALALVDHPENATRILNVYPRLDPETRQAAIGTLTARASTAAALLEAIAAERVRRQDVSAFHARQIRSLQDEALSQKLTEVWGETRESPADKQALAAKLKAQLTPERLAEANVSQGRALFQKTCATCHVMYGQGKNAGPDLTGGNRKNLDYLLENVVDPNAAVAADFRMSVLALKDGRVLNGVVVGKTDKVLTVQTQTESVFVAKDDIDEIRQTDASL
ncbi:MAG: PVC-type heme-binding CxxCH protein, partial [Planctomycetaceae bacterium]